MTSLETDTPIIVDQVTSWLTNDFAIMDTEGLRIGQILTSGSLGSRVFLGSRQLTVLASDGSVFVYLDDVVNLGLDRFELFGAGAQELATITKELTFFSKRLSVVMATGEQLTVSGDWWDLSFTISTAEGPIAQVSRSFPGIGEALLGRTRYVVGFEPHASGDHRRATLGATIAIDLIRAKARRNNAST